MSCKGGYRVTDNKSRQVLCYVAFVLFSTIQYLCLHQLLVKLIYAKPKLFYLMFLSGSSKNCVSECKNEITYPQYAHQVSPAVKCTSSTSVTSIHAFYDARRTESQYEQKGTKHTTISLTINHFPNRIFWKEIHSYLNSSHVYRSKPKR